MKKLILSILFISFVFASIGQNLKGYYVEAFTKLEAKRAFVIDLDTFYATTQLNGLDTILVSLNYVTQQLATKENILTKGNLTAGSTKVTIGGSGTNALIGTGASVDVNEANLSLQNIGGAVTDLQVPNTITLDNITQITNRSHTNLSDIGTNTHTQIDTHITNDGDMSSSNELNTSATWNNTTNIFSIVDAGGTKSDTITGFLESEVDGSITNEAQSLSVATNTATLSQANGAGGGSVTIAGGGINTVGTVGTTITVTGTEVDGSTTNELQTVDTFRIASNILELSLSSDGQPKKTVDLSAYVNPSLTNYVQNSSTSTDNAIARFDGVTGKYIQNSTAVISDAGQLSIQSTGNDVAVLGSELLADNTGAVGSADSVIVTKSISVVNGESYYITYTQTHSVGNNGSITVGLGTVNSVPIMFASTATSTATIVLNANTTGTVNLTFTLSGLTSGTITLSAISAKQFTTRTEPIALIKNSTGNANINLRTGGNTLYNNFQGINSGRHITTGSSNNASGYLSQYSLTTGSSNNALGLQSQYSLTTGNYNNASGYQSQRYLTTGSSNNALGLQSQYSLTTGNYNNALGYLSQYSLTTGSSNNALGYLSQYSLTTGSSNNALGIQSQYSLTTGSSNNALGIQSQYSLTTGSSNNASGYLSQRYLTTGSNNNASGYQSQYSLTTGSSNNASGYLSQYSLGITKTAGSFIVGLNYQIVSTGTTDFTLIGAANSNVGTNFTATGVGTGTGTAAHNSNYNIADGYEAGRYIVSGGAFEAGSNTTYIGASTRASANGVSNETAIGNGAYGVGSNSVSLGNASVNKLAVGNVEVFYQPLKSGNAGTLNQILASNGATTAPSWKDLSTLGIAPASGSGNYIQNQNASAQSANMWISGEAKANTFQSTVATGTAPLTVASTTLNTNLNADLLDTYIGGLFGLTDLNHTTSPLEIKLWASAFQPLNSPNYNYNAGITMSYLATGYSTQLSGTSGDTDELFIRGKTSGTWGNWYRIYHSGNLTNPVTGTGTANYIPKWGVGGTSLTATSNIYDNGTNVGIGTTTPGYKLDVASGTANGLRITSSASSPWVVLKTTTANTTSGGVLWYKSDDTMGSAILSNNGVADNNLEFYTGGSQRVTIKSDGNVGIGTVAPTHKIHTVGTGYFTGQAYSGQNATTDSSLVRLSQVYTKTNLETSGQSLVHWDNITNEPTFQTGTESYISSLGLTGNTLSSTGVGSAFGSTVGNIANTAYANIFTDNQTIATSSPTLTIKDNLAGSGQAGLFIQNSANLSKANFNYSSSADKLFISANTGAIGIYSNAVEALNISTAGQIKLPQYTSTTFDGTATKYLGVDIDGNVIKTTISTGTTTNALTMNNGGAGVASGTTFDGSVARTLSYNTLGAAGLSASNTFTGASQTIAAVGANLKINSTSGNPILRMELNGTFVGGLYPQSDGRFDLYSGATSYVNFASPLKVYTGISAPTAVEGGIYYNTTTDALYTSNGTTWTTSVGNVTKVGTPVNDQVGIWTGDGTIEGDNELNFNGTELLIGGGADAGTYSLQVTGQSYFSTHITSGGQGIFSGDVITLGSFDPAEIATPAAPGAGAGKLYFKSDNLAYALNDGGVEFDLTNQNERVVSISSTGTTALAATDKVIIVSGGGATLTYPTVSEGKVYIIRNTSASIINVPSYLNTTGANSTQIAAGEAITVVKVSTSWIRIQ